MLLNREYFEARKKRVVLFSGFVLALSLLEVLALFFGSSKFFAVASLATFLFGVIGVFTMYYSHLKARSWLVERLLKNLSSKAPEPSVAKQAEKLISEDFFQALSGTFLFTPKSSFGTNEFERVEGLNDFFTKYKTSRDLKTLEKESKKVLKSNKVFRVDFSEMFFDLNLLAIPFFLSLTPIFTSSWALLSVLVGFRLFTCYYYISHGRKYAWSLKSAKFKKLEHYLNGEFPENNFVNSRIQMEALLTENSKETLLLVDEVRKNELEDLVRVYAQKHEEFSDWSVISLENSIYKTTERESEKAFILFPSDMLFPFEEMKDFIGAFDQVILVDSVPSFSNKETAIFYLDHDQRIKMVQPQKNRSRLSGDKGLILRNLEKKSLKGFTQKIEEKIARKECFFLVAGGVRGEFVEGPTYVYPNKTQQIQILDAFTDCGEIVYCEIGRGDRAELLTKSKSFIANLSYPEMYADTKVELLITKNFRAS